MKKHVMHHLWKPVTSLTLASSLFFVAESTVAAQAAEENQAQATENLEQLLDENNQTPSASQEKPSNQTESTEKEQEQVDVSLAQSFPVDKEGLQNYKDQLNKEVSEMGPTEPSGNLDWVHIYETGDHNGAKVGDLIPEVNKSFGNVAGQALPDGTISQKTKEYIAIAISADDMCTKCISSHTLNNLKQGTTRQEMAEVMGVVELYGGGPKTVSAAWVIDAYDSLKYAYEDDIKAARTKDLANEKELIGHDQYENEVPEATGKTDWVGILNGAEKRFEKMGLNLGESNQALKNYVHASTQVDGALSIPQKQLIALSMGVNKGNDEVIAYHTKNLLDLGVYRREVAEALSVHYFMGGANDALNASRALDAYDALYHHFYPNGKDFPEAVAIEKESHHALYSDEDVEYDNAAKEGLVFGDIARPFPTDKDELKAYQDALEKEVSSMGDTEPSGNMDWVHIYETGNHNASKIAKLIPEVKAAFGQVAGAGMKDGAVSQKTKELVAMVLSGDDMCTKCITSHTLNSLKQGITRQEMAEAMGVVELFGGGPKTVSGAWIIDAYDTLKVAYEDEIKAGRLADEKDDQAFDRSTLTNQVPEAVGDIDWISILANAKKDISKLDHNIPEVSQAMEKYVQAATAGDTALTHVQKELLALSLAVNKGSDEAIAIHVKNLLDAGVYRQEVAETLSIHFFMGGAADALAAARALDAYDALFHANYADKGLKELKAIESYESKKIYADEYNESNQSTTISKDQFSQSQGVITDSLAQSFPIKHDQLQDYQEKLSQFIDQLELTDPSGHENWVHIYETGNHNGAKIGQLIPGVKKAFGGVAGASLPNGAVSTKVKEYIAIALSADDSCTKCITSHTINNLKQGTTRQEMAEVMGVVELYGGGPNTVRAGYVIDAYDTLAVAYEDEIKAVVADNMAKHSRLDRDKHENVVPQPTGGTDWVAILKDTKDNYNKGRLDLEGVSSAFDGFVEAASLNNSALSEVEKQFIALALAVNNGNDGGIAIHTARLLDAGVHRQEIAEVLSVSFFMGGAVDAMNSARALDAYDTLYHALYADKKDPAGSQDQDQNAGSSSQDKPGSKDNKETPGKEEAQDSKASLEDKIMPVSQKEAENMKAAQADTSSSDEEALPQTGVSAALAPLAAASILTGLGLSFTGRRKK